MLLFRIIEKTGVVLHPDAVKLEPQLAKLPTEDLLFIVLVYDYFSPYNQMPDNQKLLSASRRCYKDEKFAEHNKRLAKQIDAYRSLQYDIRRETKKNYEAKIASLNLSLFTTENPTDIKKFNEAIEYLNKAIRQIEHDLVINELDENTQYNSKSSFLEAWKENQRKYRNDKNQIDIIRARKEPIQKEES